MKNNVTKRNATHVTLHMDNHCKKNNNNIHTVIKKNKMELKNKSIKKYEFFYSIKNNSCVVFWSYHNENIHDR